MMSVTPQTLDALTLPLHGLRLIEASAGTGKTFTLAALYLRIVLERDLFPPQILVMTFTEAATAELRKRIRERLAQAAAYFKGASVAAPDDFLRDLSGAIDATQWPACATRLELAAQWMDEAAIFTIHGWCSRMLRTHAFDSASLFEQSRVADGAKLTLQAVQDYWRHWFYPLPADALDALKGVGTTPTELMGKLKPLLKRMERAPAPPPPAIEPPDVLVARWQAWQQTHQPLELAARQAWTPALVQAIRDAWAGKLLKGVQRGHLDDWLGQMQAWAQGQSIEAKTLARFAMNALQAKGWAQAAAWPALADIQVLHAHLLTEPDLKDDLLAHAAYAVLQSVQRTKAVTAQFDFSDLLQTMYAAVNAENHRLASTLAVQYPVALVDEFQDTDPWQFGILDKIYSVSPSHQKVEDAKSLEDSCSSAATCLVMIGDPKQAIYGFRGADLPTYLVAREKAQGIYTLAHNYRSTAGVVAAINTVFGQAQAPFGSVPYVPVQARNAKVVPLQRGGVPQPALTVWHAAYDKPPTKPRYLQDMAAICASEMVALLQTGAARSSDLAVLVRDWTEAAAIRGALYDRGVRSVYLSERDSVYSSAQAMDLWRILRAVANPADNRLVRAALATRTWGLGWDTLAQLLADEAGWDAQVEQFTRWQRLWREQGFLPMLYRLLHDQGLPARLLADPRDGERALTNLLHLGELLQTQAVQLQGEGALLRHLQDQLSQPGPESEVTQLRLESEADLVQVVTMHKAKGLEYPLVFLPFVSLFKQEKKDSDRSDEERLNEDIRLLYVALTRAKQALWMGVAKAHGDLDGKEPMLRGAVSALLGRKTPDDLAERLQTWVSADVVVVPAPAPTLTRFQPSALLAAPKPAHVPARLHPNRWWSASFSALTRDLDAAPVPSERDERWQDAQIDSLSVEAGVFGTPSDPVTASEARQSRAWGAPSAYQDFPAGSAYGTLLHDLLQWQAEQGWPAARDSAVAVASLPQGDWVTQLRRHAQRLSLTSDQVDLLARWVQQIVRSDLAVAQANQVPLALKIGALSNADHWPEMGFTLAVHGVSSVQLDAPISAQVWPQALRPALQPRQLQGLLTGFMDLVFQHQGRYYVLDYKSNLLSSYQPEPLQQAMLAHRYDVQATLYLLALHRLLKSRLPDYDYDQHVGGALYLFLRGIDQPGQGLVQLRPARELIDALDEAMRTPAAQERDA